MLILGAIASIVFFIHNSIPKVVYQPVNACDLLSFDEAQQLLGDKAVPSGSKQVAVSGHLANSKCGYTDANPDTDSLVVAAISIRSGIDDEGTAKNKADFRSNNTGRNIEKVENVGDEAFFNHSLGQLNVLRGHDWIILSFGAGSAPESNTIENAILLANKVLN